MAFKLNPLTGQLDLIGSSSGGVTDVTGTAPIVSSGGTTPAISLPAATAVADGYATSTQITKLDGIEALADVTDATNVAAAGAIMDGDYGAKGNVLVGTGAGTWTALTVGADATVLTADAAEASGVKWAAAGGSGQTLYDKIVAASGGTHTTLGAALAAASAGDSIFVRSGTYTEGAITCALNNITVVGEDRLATILDFSTNNLTFSGTNLRFSNLTANFTTGQISSSGNYGDIHDCDLSHTSTNSGMVVSGSYTNVYRNYLAYGGSLQGVEAAIAYGSISDNYIYSTSTANTRYAIYAATSVSLVVSKNVLRFSSNHRGIIVGAGCTVSNNVLLATATSSSGVGIAPADDCSVISNTITGFLYAIYAGGRSNLTIVGNSMKAFWTYGLYLTDGTTQCVVGSNTIQCIGSRGTGMYLDNVDNSSITGNALKLLVTGINITSTSTNNVVSGTTFETVTTPMTITSLTSKIVGNMTTPVTQHVDTHYMKNTSGGALAAGDVVIWKSVAAGNEVTTTTTAADTKVFGMVTEAIANNASGTIQTLGKTTALKVNGTTDIAIGDFLTTFTTAGIAAKAAAGQTAFAIALEAYTTDDSAGVLDALLISPRII